LLDSIGVDNRDCRHDSALLDPTQRAHYLFNTTIAGIEEADVCLMIGTDARLLSEIFDGRDPLAQELAAAKNPMLILGASVMARPDGEEIFMAAKAIA